MDHVGVLFCVSFKVQSTAIQGHHSPWPTAQSPDALILLHHDMYPHSMGTPALVPIAAPQSDLLLLLHCMSQHPMGSHSHVPTATHPSALPQQLRHKSLNPTHNHVPWPTVGVAMSAVLLLHMWQAPRGTPHASSTAPPRSGHHQQQRNMPSCPKGSH
jgi:hypothetical protein